MWRHNWLLYYITPCSDSCFETIKNTHGDIWITAVSMIVVKYTQRNFSEVLLNQLEIRLYLPFSDWFGSKRMSVWIQINRKIVYTIWFRVDLIRFLCVWPDHIHSLFFIFCKRKCSEKNVRMTTFLFSQNNPKKLKT